MIHFLWMISKATSYLKYSNVCSQQVYKKKISPSLSLKRCPRLQIETGPNNKMRLDWVMTDCLMIVCHQFGHNSAIKQRHLERLNNAYLSLMVLSLIRRHWMIWEKFKPSPLRPKSEWGIFLYNKCTLCDCF